MRANRYLKCNRARAVCRSFAPTLALKRKYALPRLICSELRTTYPVRPYVPHVQKITGDRPLMQNCRQFVSLPYFVAARCNRSRIHLSILGDRHEAESTECYILTVRDSQKDEPPVTGSITARRYRSCTLETSRVNRRAAQPYRHIFSRMVDLLHSSDLIPSLQVVLLVDANGIYPKQVIVGRVAKRALENRA